MTPTREEIIEFFGNANELGQALKMEFLENAKESILQRSAELAGARFQRWLRRRRLGTLRFDR